MPYSIRFASDDARKVSLPPVTMHQRAYEAEDALSFGDFIKFVDSLSASELRRALAILIGRLVKG